ncbi:hypothetical protein F4775DRAFT_546998 [Biscogniauxia sp. FL1348]|nr:hypothetical protein F4775DRAFT_546998 [Biscogniauxia sp. FL1348]
MCFIGLSLNYFALLHSFTLALLRSTGATEDYFSYTHIMYVEIEGRYPLVGRYLIYLLTFDTQSLGQLPKFPVDREGK